MLYIILSAVLHEIAHIYAMKKCGLDIKEIALKPFGINIKIKDGKYIAYKKEILIALAGPIANLLAAIIVFLFNIFIYRFEAGVFIVVVNLLLAFLNLLPIDRLDGGEILKNLLLMKFEPYTVDKICYVTSIIFLTPILFFGGILLYKTGYNFSLLIIGFYLLISIAIKSKD